MSQRSASLKTHNTTDCNILQHTATHCNILSHMSQRSASLKTHNTTDCNTLQHTATLYDAFSSLRLGASEQYWWQESPLDRRTPLQRGGGFSFGVSRFQKPGGKEERTMFLEQRTMFFSSRLFLITISHSPLPPGCWNRNTPKVKPSLSVEK